ncbi:MAG: EAL domain-containing protein [Magnetovibrio sp.]|nr:EAL domain-containing protein [Magnetovibrio sp.]
MNQPSAQTTTTPKTTPKTTTTPAPAARVAPDLKAERDRFVALAFCWADFLLELDVHETITFAGGPWKGLVGKTPKELKGTKILDLVMEKDQSLMRSLLGVAKRHGRIEDVDIRFRGQSNAGLAIGFAGYFLEDLKDSYFLAMRVNRNAGAGLVAGGHVREGGSKLFDADSFADVLGGKIKAGDDDNHLTFINMPGLETIKGRMSEEEQEELSKALGLYLRANSVDGDSAAQIEEGKFGLVHAADLDMSGLEDQLAEVALELDPKHEVVKVESATMEVDANNVSEADLANGLVYAINQFKDHGNGKFNLSNLSSNISGMVKDAANKVATFKNIVANKSFSLVYHPIINVSTGEVHHYEALTRFQPGVSPFEIITMAEEMGLIPEFDLTVVEKGLEFLDTLPRNAKTAIAVNISGQSVANEMYVSNLHRIIKQNQWAKGKLMFEITESAKMDDLEQANNFIQSLRSEGYHVCLDDFGAGAASFGYLMSLEVDVVKLDGPVVKDAQKAVRGKALLESMATLCKNLGIETIGEMVDDKNGLDFVRKCGIDYAQGFLFGEPNADINAFNLKKFTHLFPNAKRSTSQIW